MKRYFSLTLPASDKAQRCPSHIRPNWGNTPVGRYAPATPSFVLALIAIAITGCGGGVESLSEELQSDDVETRQEAARKLADYDEEAAPAVPALTKALSDSDEDVRRLSAYALGRIGPDAKESTDELAKLLEDDKRPVRLAAAYALVNIDPENTAPLQILTNAARTGDVRSIVALGQMGPVAKSAVPTLIQSLTANEIVVRLNAVRALGKIDPDSLEVRAALEHRKERDNDPEVREAAAAILDRE